MLGASLLSAAPQDTGLKLLRRAASPQGARYVATRRVEVREGGKPKIHEERLVRDGRRLRISFAPGSRYEGQSVIELPNGRFIVDPRRREIRRLPSRGEEMERRIGRFVRLVQDGKFSLKSSDGGRVAGLPTRRVLLSREGKPFVALFIEPRTSVVLRRESFGAAGRLSGNYVFTRFEPRTKIDSKEFALPKTGYRFVSPLDDLRALGKRVGIVVRMLPDTTGYRLEGSRTRKTPAGTILASFYSGGGKRLTLFASREELPELPARGSGSRIPASGVVLYRWRVGSTNYGLLGEETLSRLSALAATSTP